MINLNLDQPADVIWVPADQVPETGTNSPRTRGTSHLYGRPFALPWRSYPLLIGPTFGSLPRRAILQLNRSNSSTDR